MKLAKEKEEQQRKKRWAQRQEELKPHECRKVCGVPHF